MKVFVLDGLGHPTTLDASRVVVMTDSGTPVAFSIELMLGMIENAHTEDEHFNAKLRAHGIDKTVQISEVRVPRIEDFDFQV